MPRSGDPRSTAGKNSEGQLKTTVDRTTELSEEVLQSVEDGQRAAIEAVRKFVDTVDQALPPHGEGPSRAEEIVDSALEMSSTWSTPNTTSSATSCEVPVSRWANRRPKQQQPEGAWIEG